MSSSSERLPGSPILFFKLMDFCTENTIKLMYFCTENAGLLVHAAPLAHRCGAAPRYLSDLRGGRIRRHQVMNLTFIMMNFAFKMMNFVLKMPDFVISRLRSVVLYDIAADKWSTLRRDNSSEHGDHSSSSSGSGSSCEMSEVRAVPGAAWCASNQSAISQS